MFLHFHFITPPNTSTVEIKLYLIIVDMRASYISTLLEPV
jgi:hypothetical protein